MNATQANVKMRDPVLTVIIRTHVSVRVDILVSTAKRVSNGLYLMRLAHFIHGHLS